MVMMLIIPTIMMIINYNDDEQEYEIVQSKIMKKFN